MPDIVRLIVAIIAVPLCVKAAMAEDAVLLSSTAPGYTAGMVVAESDRLNLPEGASMTLLFQSGEILRLGGPFDGTISPPAPGADSSAARLAEIFKARGTDASVIGGTRSTGRLARKTEADDVVIEPQRSGTYCVTPSSSVWIARPPQDHSPVALRRKGNSRALAWPVDSERIEWPADVPIDDGSQFEIVSGGLSRSLVTFRMLPSDTASEPAWVAKGITLGCEEQFGAALRRISLSAAQPELWITTDRGRSPAFRIGEPVHLTVTASVDGYAYCFAEGADGSATPVFPAGAVDGAQLRGSTALTIPGPRQPAVLKAGPDLRHVRCWLADRNISAELPNALIAGPATRIPERLAADLSGFFTRVGGTRIATADVAIETTENAGTRYTSGP